MAKRPEFLNERERRESRVLSAVLTVACILLVLVFAADLYITNNFLLVIVDGSSMENTLHDGDALYIDVHDTPERGDIIVLDVTDYPEYPHDGNGVHYIIKRVIALGGDEAYAEDGVVYLKKAGDEEFSALEEPYANGATESFSLVKVEEGEVFFLGDNRGNSLDARTNGCLPLSDVVGVVTSFSLAHKDFIAGWVRFWHPGLA